MLKKLSRGQQEWVDSTLRSMTLHEAVGQCLCPWFGGTFKQEYTSVLEQYPVGTVFFSDWSGEDTLSVFSRLQSLVRIPLLISMDMEGGLPTGITFPSAMGCAAGTVPATIRKRGRVTGHEARSTGVHWSFAPNVDISYTIQNLETNNRAWGDNPDDVAKYTVPLIKGMQEKNRLAATAKHFPGTGIDDRDQHICTAVNTFSVKKWHETYGRVWRAVIDAGVMSIMGGHISFPAYEGLARRPWEALPATLSPKLMIRLLRNELGFEGVMVSDAVPMIGFTSRIRKGDEAGAFLAAGGDVCLSIDPKPGFESIMDYLQRGLLSEDRIYEAARRVCEMKARLEITDTPRCPKPDADERKSYIRLAAKMAHDGITLQRNDGTIPLSLEKGARVLTVTLCRSDPREEYRDVKLPFINEELQKRGFHVDTKTTPPNEEMIQAMYDYDAIFLNITVGMHSTIGSIRIIDRMIMTLWNSFWTTPGKARVVFTSFSSPFHLYEFPHWPNMILTYSGNEAAQRAVVQVWLGEKKATGRLPVKMPLLSGITKKIAVAGRSESMSRT